MSLSPPQTNVKEIFEKDQTQKINTLKTHKKVQSLRQSMIIQKQTKDKQSFSEVLTLRQQSSAGGHQRRVNNQGVPNTSLRDSSFRSSLIQFEKCRSPRVISAKITKPGENLETLVCPDATIESKHEEAQVTESQQADWRVTTEEEFQSVRKQIKPQFVKKHLKTTNQVRNSISPQQNGKFNQFATFQDSKLRQKLNGQKSSVNKLVSPLTDKPKSKAASSSITNRKSGQVEKQTKLMIDNSQTNLQQNLESQPTTADASNKATATPVKFDCQLKTFSIKEVSKFLEESPDQQNFIHNTFNLKKLNTPIKIESEPQQPMFQTQLMKYNDANPLSQTQNNDFLSKTFDKEEESFYPSQRSTFSYAPKYFKPSCSSFNGGNKLSNSNNSPLNASTTTNFLEGIMQANNNSNGIVAQRTACSSQQRLMQTSQISSTRNLQIYNESMNQNQQSYSQAIQDFNTNMFQRNSSKNIIITPKQLNMKAVNERHLSNKDLTSSQRQSIESSLRISEAKRRTQFASPSLRKSLVNQL